MGGKSPKPNPRLDNRLKDVEEKLDVPPLRPELRSFVDWVANYTVSSRGMVLRMCLRMGEHLGPERERTGVKLAGASPQRMTAARGRVLELLADGMLRGKGEAAREAGVSMGVIDGLIDEGTLETVVLPPEPVAEKPDPDFMQPEFRTEQRAAADALKATIAKGGYSVTLLDGVTGSGKTEVYFEAVADTIRAGRQSLILMPEIALTAPFLDRFAARFGTRPAEWHSELTPRKRARTWAAVAKGEVSVVVGARSALFLPYADLGLIVVDEEHDPAYKQEDGVHYHARDMAVVRGHIAKIPVVLSSATPSLETEVNARRGRYARLALPERFGGQRMPSVEAIDLRHRAAAARPLHRADARRCDQDRAGAQGAGAALSQSPRLRAADAVPRLRLPLLLPELRRLAGRSPLPPHAGLPPLRLRHAASGQLPEMPGGGFLCRRRAGRRAARRGGAANCFRRRACWCCRPISSPRSSACARNSPRSPPASSTSSSAPSSSPRAITSRCSIWSASSTPISASPTAIRAPPSAPSSCCIRWSAAPAAMPASATAICRPISPSIR